LSWGPLSLL